MPNLTLRRAAIFSVITLLSSCSGETGLPAGQAKQTKPVAVATAQHPTVVELFQSQGCSSCPPANANINAISDRPDVLTLSFAVTYWDKLGWKDRFAKPAFTERQWDYAHGGGRANVYTPQVIVNGKAAIVGNVRAELDRLIAASGRPAGGPDVSVSGNSVTIAGGKSPATVWLVRYDPASRDVPIRAGENNGRTLPHRHIVTELVEIGKSGSTSRSFALPPAAAHTKLEAAILVQVPNGGPIIAATRI